MKHEAVKIAVERADGGVSILSFYTVGRGNLLPAGAVWIDEKTGWWTRSPEDAVVAAEVARSEPGFVAWHRLMDDEVPQDRTFRDALVVKNGALAHDVAQARELVRREIRHKRAVAMPELDALWMRATGQGKKADADKIEKQRQAWRDAPADPRIDAAQTVDALAALLPAPR